MMNLRKIIQQLFWFQKFSWLQKFMRNSKKVLVKMYFCTIQILQNYKDIKFGLTAKKNLQKSLLGHDQHSS